MIELPLWHDLHTHIRQDTIMPHLIKAHLAMGCAGILAMPNTAPPVAKIFQNDSLPYLSIEEYLKQIRASGGDSFESVIVPLYLTKDTSPSMIEKGARAGLLRACKYYPPHGTTGAGYSIAFDSFFKNGVFQAMEETGTILCLHGEAHDLRPEDYFARNTNAEEIFYREQVPRLIDKHPRLRIVAEHLTTKYAVDLVHQADNLGATVTPQHLLYTIGDLLRGLKYHLYCLPLLKFEEDRAALREAATEAGNKKFFAGTDSAPHVKKATPCGCAAGCYTGGIAPQLYAQAFEKAGASLDSEDGLLAFKKFLCLNGPAFYDLPVSQKTFNLARKEQSIHALETPEGSVIPLPLGMEMNPEKRESTLPWRIVSDQG